MDCVDVCPVECFHEGENMLVIDPDGCIDCGVCEPECPVEAILPDTMTDESWVTLNKEFASKWPLVTVKGDACEDADSFADQDGKFVNHFSSLPGKGDP
jgi:ferredoxin